MHPTTTPGRAVSPEEIHTARMARARLEIDLAALRHNIDRIRLLSSGAHVMAVIKGDAYGLGGPEVARELTEAGVEAFAVDNVAEGLALRSGGLRLPIMIIDGDVADNCEVAIRHELEPGIPHVHLLHAYQQTAAQLGTRHKVWLVSNVGFNRSGYRTSSELAAFAEKAKQCANLEVQGLYAHLTNATADDDDTNKAQIALYREQIEVVRSVLGRHLQTSLFASHSIPRWAPEIATDWVRPGILMYGEDCYDPKVLDVGMRARMAEFRPVVSLRARVVGVLEFRDSQAVGYGQRYHTRPGQRLATVAVGFGSGFPRGAIPAEAIVHGRRAPLFGPVGMDALQIDSTDIPTLAPGDWVTLIGQEGDVKITASDLARVAKISPYELIGRLTLARTYQNREEPVPTLKLESI